MTLDRAAAPPLHSVWSLGVYLQLDWTFPRVGLLWVAACVRDEVTHFG